MTNHTSATLNHYIALMKWQVLSAVLLICVPIGGWLAWPTHPRLSAQRDIVLPHELGTPTSGTLTNLTGTGLPITTGISGMGTGVATFTAGPSGSIVTTSCPAESAPNCVWVSSGGEIGK